MKKEIKFPENFYWGSAFSSPQTEPNGIEDAGGSNSIWEKWYLEEKGRFYNQKFALNNFKENYHQDLEIAKNIGMNSLRSSISWSKIVPNRGEINQEAIKFYKDVFEEYKKNDLEIFMNLFHFDMPVWAQELGGWTSREVVDEFVLYAKTCFNEFGRYVKYWFTFNEPIVSVEAQYLYDWHYPNIIDFDLAMIALWNTNIAHSLVVKEFKKLNLESEIGIILNITPAIPRSTSNKEDVKAAKAAELFQWKSYLDTILKKEFPPELITLLKDKNVWPSSIDIEKGNAIFSENEIDILGINYYSPLRVKALDYKPDWDGNVSPNTHFFNAYAMPYARINEHRGWEIYPKALYDMLKCIKDEYGNIKHFVSENGMGVSGEERFKDENGIIQDDYRIKFLTEHIFWMHKAIQEGSNCIGYHMWTYIDNWSWANAYKNRYGFISLNIETGERIPKKSANWFKQLATKNTLQYNEDDIIDA